MSSINNKLVVSIIGNIGAGKSTLLAKLKDDYLLIEEGVDDWIDDKGFNWLDAFYKDPVRWTFSFQMRVLQTLDNTRNYIKTLSNPVVLTERSPLDSRRVFFEYHKEKKWVSDAEYSLYDFHWNKIAWKPDVLIYIDSEPEVCHKRVGERGRPEESSLSLQFFKDMDKHYKLLVQDTTIPIFVVDNNLDGDLDLKALNIKEFIRSKEV